MKEENSQDTRNRDRRIFERYEVDTPQGSLKYNGNRIPCAIIDVSLGGCCLRTETLFVAGNLAHVVVEMPIHGMLLKMTGITQWTSRNNLVGVRFIHPSQRSKNELAGLLTCLVDKSAADVVAAAVVAAAAAPSAEQALNLEIPEALLQSLRPPGTSVETPEVPEAAASPSTSEEPAGSDANTGSKLEKDTAPVPTAPAPSSEAPALEPKPPKKRLFGVFPF